LFIAKKIPAGYARSVLYHQEPFKKDKAKTNMRVIDNIRQNLILLLDTTSDDIYVMTYNARISNIYHSLLPIESHANKLITTLDTGILIPNNKLMITKTKTAI
jgi:hypothetical protein